VPRQWYDILGRGADNDILQDGGFLFALKETLRLRPGALLFAEVPCSRWFACIYDGVFWTSQWTTEHVHVMIRFCPYLGWQTVELSWVWLASFTHQRYSTILGDTRVLSEFYWNHFIYVFSVWCWNQCGWSLRRSIRPIRKPNSSTLRTAMPAGICSQSTPCGLLDDTMLEIERDKLQQYVHIHYDRKNKLYFMLCAEVEQPSSSQLVYFPYLQFMWQHYHALFKRLHLVSICGFRDRCFLLKHLVK
jgi:hypothetical protein